MPLRSKSPDVTMTFLEHLDELRSRLLRCALVFVGTLSVCWYFSGPILKFVLLPVRQFLPEGGDIIFIQLSEPFFVYMQASALAALFIASPFLLYQLWGFVAPGLYRHERRLGVAFLVFGTAFFVAGGAFGYYIAVPMAAKWLLGLGQDFKAALTLRSVFQFQSRMLLGLGVVFELPTLIFFFARLGLVTPEFLMRHFRVAVVVIAVLAAVITPTGDMLTMCVFGGPMVLLYLLGVAVSWIFGRRPEAGA